MPGGYAGKFAEIDLTRGTVKEVTFPEEVLRTWVGGRALGAWITWQRLKDKPWEAVDPLGPDNILLFLTGPVNGLYPGSRTCVTGKSPQSNGILGSSAGSWFDAALKMAGWDGLIITGRATSPVYLWVFDDKIEVRDASKWWGKRVTETRNGILRELKSELDKKRPSRHHRPPAIALIGPAGENKCRNAAVIFDQEKAAGRGGYGAVMGSKNLKAIAVYGTKPLPEPADKTAWKTLLDALIARNIVRYEAYRRWGTARGIWQFGWWTASMPVRNWQDEWHDKIAITGPHVYEHGLWVRVYWSRCWMCVQHCYKTAVVVEPGKQERLVSELPDYENQAMQGAIGDIWDADEICRNTMLCNELGFDTIGIGATVALAFELYEKGILTKEDTGGLELKWGDAKAWRTFHEMIAARKGIGAVFAEGAHRAALEIAKRKGLPPEKILYYAIECKGIEWGAHGNRSKLDAPWRWTITYSVSVQGGDHTSNAAVKLEDRELPIIINDTAMFCSFTAPAIDHAAMWLTAVTGWSYSVDTLREIALRSIMVQRAALLLGGPDIKWYDEKTGRAIDVNPGRMMEEPLPSGPVKGRKIDPAEYEKELKEYYETHGFDERGIPRSEILLALGLKDVDDALKKLRR